MSTMDETKKITKLASRHITARKTFKPRTVLYSLNKRAECSSGAHVNVHTCPSNHINRKALGSLSVGHSVHSVDLWPLPSRFFQITQKRRRSIVMTRGHITGKRGEKKNHPLLMAQTLQTSNPPDAQATTHQLRSCEFCHS